MALTATLLDLNRDDGAWNFVIVYTDGVTKVSRRHRASSLDNASIAAIARADAAELNNASGSVSKVSLSPGDVIDLTPPAVVAVTPSASELAQSAWFADWRLYRQLKSLADAGVSSSTLEPIANVQARLQKNWLDNYLVLV